MASIRARGALLAALLLEAVTVSAPIPVHAAGGHGHPGRQAHASTPHPSSQPRLQAGASGNGSPQNGLQAQRAIALAQPTPPALAGPTTTPAPTPLVTPVVPVSAVPPVAPGVVPRPVPRVGIPVVAPGPAAPAIAPSPVAFPAAAPRRDPPLAGFPPIVLPPGPEGQRLEVVLMVLPLLLAIWLWALVRAAAATWSQRGAASRSAIANQLGLRTEQLAGLDPEGLRRLRDGIAFDELTGVLRRAAGLASLERELARAARSAQPLSVAFIDVDGLKAANDTLGHAAGDALLRGIAGVLTRRLRAQDLVFRYGGDEFVCVMPATSRPRAEAITAEMRQMAAGAGLPFSFGVAQGTPGEPARALIARADSLQYLDKQARRSAR